MTRRYLEPGERINQPRARYWSRLDLDGRSYLVVDTFTFAVPAPPAAEPGIYYIPAARDPLSPRAKQLAKALKARMRAAA